MRARAPGDFAKWLMLIVILPLALAGGLIHGLIAQKLSKGREPWFTIFMIVGLAVTIFTIQWASHDLSIRAAWLFLGTAFLYLGLRRLFGRGGGQPLEAFLLPHICAILICLLFPVLGQIKIRRSPRNNMSEPHQSAPR